LKKDLIRSNFTYWIFKRSAQWGSHGRIHLQCVSILNIGGAKNVRKIFEQDITSNGSNTNLGVLGKFYTDKNLAWHCHWKFGNWFEVCPSPQRISALSRVGAVRQFWIRVGGIQPLWYQCVALPYNSCYYYYYYCDVFKVGWFYFLSLATSATYRYCFLAKWLARKTPHTTKCGAGRRTPLVSFSHVIDPHSVTFSSILYTTIRNPNPNANPNPSPNPNRNPAVITDRQIGPRDTQIGIVLVLSADLPRSAFCRVPKDSSEDALTQ